MIKGFTKTIIFIISMCFLIVALFGFNVFASEIEYAPKMDKLILEKATYSGIKIADINLISSDNIKYSVIDAVYDTPDSMLAMVFTMIV